jgi:hypothetical protein
MNDYTDGKSGYVRYATANGSSDDAMRAHQVCVMR